MIIWKKIVWEYVAVSVVKSFRLTNLLQVVFIFKNKLVVRFLKTNTGTKWIKKET